MPLRYHASDNFHIAVGGLTYGQSSFPEGVVKRYDPIAAAFNTSFLAIGTVGCDRLFGYKASEGWLDELDRGYLSTGPYDSLLDWRRYGSTFGVLREIVVPNKHIFDYRGEHQATHYQSEGNVIPYTGVAAFLHDGGLQSPAIANAPDGVHCTLDYYNYRLKSSYASAGRRSYSLVAGAGGSMNRRHLIFNDKLFGTLARGASFTTTQYFPNWNTTSDVTNIDFGFDPVTGNWYVKYHLFVDSTQAGVTGCGYDVAWYFNISFQYGDGSRSYPAGTASEQLDATTMVHMVQYAQYKLTANSFPWPNYGFAGGSGVVGSTWYLTVDVPIMFTGNPYVGNIASPFSLVHSGLETIYSKRRTEIEGQFRSWFELNMYSIRAATALSSASAMANLSSSTNTDVLQNLVKLNDITSQLPHIADAVAILRKISNRDLSSVTDLISFLTQLRLQQSFQWRPELDLLLTYLPKIQATLLSLPTGSPTLTGYGKYEYDFLSTESIRTTHLVCRTKIVVSSDIMPSLATYLKLDGLGITPSAANLWDIVPFSFVVNWFTNMGARIRTLGQEANLWLLDPIVVVHTFTLTSFYTSQELSDMNFGVNPGTEGPYMKLFQREVSRFIALPRTSRFDFQRPIHPPEWSIVGSLLWQWMT